MIFQHAIKHIVVGQVVVLLAASWAYAVVDTIDATVTAKVEEFDSTGLINSDTAFEDLDQSTGNLPLFVDVGFFHTDADGADVAGASATTTFNDPRLSQSPDPDEFGIDTAVFSETTDIYYTGLSNATETRNIIYTARDISEPVGTELRVRSRFFVDGILVVWGQYGNNDLSGTTAEISLNVKQTRPGDSDPTTVLEASLIVTGQQDGTAVVTAGGKLNIENVTVIDMTDSVTELGSVHLVIIPDTAISYLYSTKVGEEFVLKAEIEGKVHNQPGTGASVALGVPLLELIGLITDVTGSDVGNVLGDALQNVLSFGPPPSKPLVANGPDPEITVVGKENNSLLSILNIPLCGMVGVESILLATMFIMAMLIPLRRRGF